MTPDSLVPYQTDHLFLLVGTNPLPNWVAAMLLARGDGKIYLLHTPTQKGTVVVANRLKAAIVRDLPGMSSERVILREISESKRNDIVSKVNTLLDQMNRSVGLNYTGGTKPMALHVYRAIEQRLGSDAIFSYLDARSLETLIEEHREEQRIVPAQSQPVPRNLQLSIEHLMALHGYVRSWDEKDVERRKAALSREGKPADAPQQTPLLEDLCHALATVHSTKDGYRAWREFIKPRPLRRLPLTSDDKWLQPVAEALDRLRVDGRSAEEELVRILGYKGLSSCQNWLEGEWLEEYALGALAETARELDIKHYGINLKPLKPGEKNAPHEILENDLVEEAAEETEKQQKEKKDKKDKRQIDLVAMYGYQLFTISCQATQGKDAAQEHLFEVFTRARQLGGDEARIGVITCLEPSIAALLQKEIERDWDADGKIKVFAQNHLPRLSAHLADWFRQANKG